MARTAPGAPCAVPAIAVLFRAAGGGSGATMRKRLQLPEDAAVRAQRQLSLGEHVALALASQSTVLVRGQELTLRWRPRGRGLLLPLQGPEIPLVLRMLMADMRDQTKADVRKRLRVDRTAVSLVESDTGRVLWLPSQCSWQVLYQDAEGVMRRTARGFRVPVTTVAP